MIPFRRNIIESQVYERFHSAFGELKSVVFKCAFDSVESRIAPSCADPSLRSISGVDRLDSLYLRKHARALEIGRSRGNLQIGRYCLKDFTCVSDRIGLRELDSIDNDRVSLGVR